MTQRRQNKKIPRRPRGAPLHLCLSKVFQPLGQPWSKINKKEKLMTEHEQNRVLGRLGARELTSEEVEMALGYGPEHTNVITFNPVTGRDGDG